MSLLQPLHHLHSKLEIQWKTSYCRCVFVHPGPINRARICGWHGDGNTGRQMIWANSDEIWGISRMSLNLNWSVISRRISRYCTSTTNGFFIWRLVNCVDVLHNLQILWKCLVESCLVHFRAISLLKCMGWNLMMTWWHHNSPIIGLTCLVILGPVSPVPDFPSYSPSNAFHGFLAAVGKFGRSKFLTNSCPWIQMPGHMAKVGEKEPL